MLNPSVKIVAVVSLIISIGVTYATLYVIISLNVEPDIIQSIINFCGVLIGGIIGGYIAYIASNSQIKANKNIERYKELKKEFSACLIAKEDLNTIIKRISKFETDTTYGEVGKYIDISYLEKFKNEYLYLLNEKDSSRFYSSFNRLKLITIREPNKTFKIEKIKALVEHLVIVKNYIDNKKTSINYDLFELKKFIKK